MTRDPRVYVEHVAAAIALIERWTSSGRESFLRDELLQSAVIRKLHELAESIQRLEPLVGSRYPDVPWRDVVGFRHVVVHDYLGLNVDRIWLIVSQHVPALKPQIERMLNEL